MQMRTRFCETVFWEKDSQKPRLIFFKFGGNWGWGATRRKGLGGNARGIFRVEKMAEKC